MNETLHECQENDVGLQIVWTEETMEEADGAQVSNTVLGQQRIDTLIAKWPYWFPSKICVWMLALLYRQDGNVRENLAIIVIKRTKSSITSGG